jgi:hypothetical protein
MARGTRAQWADRVRRWRASGQSAAAFAALEGVKPTTLQWWSSQLKMAALVPGFIEVVQPVALPSPTDGLVEVILSNDVRIRVSGQFDLAVLRRAVAALGGR